VYSGSDLLFPGSFFTPGSPLCELRKLSSAHVESNAIHVVSFINGSILGPEALSIHNLHLCRLSSF